MSQMPVTDPEAPPSEAVACSILWDLFTETDDGEERDELVARFVEEEEKVPCSP